MVLRNKPQELRITSLTASIPTRDTTAVLGRLRIITDSRPDIPISAYIKAAEQAHSAPRQINSAAPKGCPNTHNPKKNAAIRNIRSVTSVPVNISSSEPPNNSGHIYRLKTAHSLIYIEINEPAAIPANSISRRGRSHFPLLPSDM